MPAARASAAVLPAPATRPYGPTRTRPAAPARQRPPARKRRSGDLASKTVGAVGRLPESPAVRGMAKSRIWIGVIGVLLAGIVAVNVITVSLGADLSHTQVQIQKLERENTILGSQAVNAVSIPTVQAEAGEAGMVTPPTEEINFLTHSPEHFAAAAERLAAQGG